MAKADQEAFNQILSLVNSGAIVQIEQRFNGYEVTVWPDKYDHLQHTHYQGETLLEAVSKAAK